MQNNVKKINGKMPFFLTFSVALIAVGGISWTHGSVLGKLFFCIGLALFGCVSLIWLKQSVVFFKQSPKIAFSGLIWAVFAVFMFLFSGVLEKGYDVATKQYGVNGKIDENNGNKGVISHSVSTNVDFLVNFSKMPLLPIVIEKKDKYPLDISYGSDFDIVIWLKNPYKKPISMRALLSVIPSTSATLIKAREKRYPIINIAPLSEKKLVLKLHLSEKVPEHIHDLTVGVSFFGFDNINKD
jgi:hypothetical protein